MVSATTPSLGWRQKRHPPNDADPGYDDGLMTVAGSGAVITGLVL